MGNPVRWERHRATRVGVKLFCSTAAMRVQAAARRRLRRAAARHALALGGGVFLLWLGWRIWRQTPTVGLADGALRMPVLRAWATTALLTLSNPMTILSFVGTFAALGGRATGAGPGVMVLGVFLGSAAWWLLLAGGVRMLHRRLPARLLEWARQGSALLLLGFGAWALWSALA